jgi:hypothetical protein
VAHNAGNNLRTTETAVRDGATAIEIDVKSARVSSPQDETNCGLG